MLSARQKPSLCGHAALTPGSLRKGLPREQSWELGLGGSLGLSWSHKKFKDLVCQMLGGSFSKPGLDFLLPQREGCTEQVLTFRR